MGKVLFFGSVGRELKFCIPIVHERGDSAMNHSFIERIFIVSLLSVSLAV